MHAQIYTIITCTRMYIRSSYTTCEHVPTHRLLWPMRGSHILRYTHIHDIWTYINSCTLFYSHLMLLYYKSSTLFYSHLILFYRSSTLYHSHFMLLYSREIYTAIFFCREIYTANTPSDIAPNWRSRVGGDTLSVVYICIKAMRVLYTLTFRDTFWR